MKHTYIIVTHYYVFNRVVTMFHRNAYNNWNHSNLFMTFFSPYTLSCTYFVESIYVNLIVVHYRQ